MESDNLDYKTFKGLLFCFRDFDCVGLTTRQPLCVILCRLPEKGRKVIEEIVEEIKQRDREERNRNENEETEEICLEEHLPLPATRIARLAQL